MNCNDIRSSVTAQGFQADRLDAASREHLADCDLCRAWYRDEVLRLALTSLRVPSPNAGFEDRAIERAVAAHGGARRPARHWAAAAALALVVSAVVTVATGVRDTSAPMQEEVVAAPQPTYQMINVVIDSSTRRDDATLTIRLAEDLELEGYAGLHTIEWQTDIEQGRNLLALPVRTKTSGGGEIWIALSYGGANEAEMRIQVDAG
jgi:predicted anti-sigma-YlaC factor YlaD